MSPPQPDLLAKMVDRLGDLPPERLAEIRALKVKSLDRAGAPQMANTCFDLITQVPFVD